MSHDFFIKSLCEFASQLESIDATKKSPKQKDPGYNKTEKQIVNMLTENTGAHILDSGGIYGRHWQRNRLIQDFRDLPHIRYNNGEYFIKSLFHVLNDHLEFDPKMQNKLNRFGNREKYKKESWDNVLDDFLESLDAKNIVSGYTYNEETVIDQDFIYYTFDLCDESYIIIRTHNGSDARGGFSDPKCFKVNDYDAPGTFLFMDLSSISGSCECGYCDSSDAGYYWESDFNQDHKFPKSWIYSQRKNAYYCKNCKMEVNFS